MSSSSTTQSKRNSAVTSSSGKCPFRKRQTEGNILKRPTNNVKTPLSDNIISENKASSPTSPEAPAAASVGYDSGGMSGGYGGMGNMGMGMGGMGMGGYGMGMGGMGGYGMGGYGMGGYGMMGADGGGVMGSLMNQLIILQSINCSLMSFGHIVQSLGINAGSIIQFGQNILRTLDSLAIAIRKSGMLSSSSTRTAATLSDHQQDKYQQVRRRRRAVLLRWTLVVLTMAVTSQILRILRYFSNSPLPSALAQQIFHFFRSFFTADVLKPATPSHLLKEGNV